MSLDVVSSSAFCWVTASGPTCVAVLLKVIVELVRLPFASGVGVEACAGGATPVLGFVWVCPTSNVRIWPVDPAGGAVVENVMYEPLV